MVNNIKDKSILLIAPIFYNYHDLIINSLTKQGAKVSFVQEKQYGLIINFMRYISRNFSSYYSNLFLASRIKEKANNQFDYVLVIHGEYVDKKILKLIRNLFGGIKLIAYHWDSFTHNKNGLETAALYDKVYSFDRSDVSATEMIEYLPLFHTIEDSSQFQSNQLKDERDLLFIGIDYSDRITIVKKLVKNCKELSLKFEHHLVSSKFSFYRKKVTFSRRYRNTDPKDFKFSKLSHNVFLEMIAASKAVLDINVEGQAGLTMRTIEVLALGKKLVTTNNWIKYEPFYDENLIYIIDRENPIIDKIFFDTEISQLDMSKFHIDNWIQVLLK